MKYKDIDQFARSLPGLNEQFTISSQEGHLLGDRLVEMLDKVEALEKKLREGGPGVVHLLEATATERDELKRQVESLTSKLNSIAIYKGSEPDPPGGDLPWTKCLLCDTKAWTPKPIAHKPGCMLSSTVTP